MGVKWGASSRWSSSLHCPMRNSSEMTIGDTHSTLQWCYSEHSMMKTWIRVLQKSNEREKGPVPHIFNFVHGSWSSMVRPKFGHYSSMVNSLPLNPQKGRYNVFAATNATRIYSQLSTWAPKSCWRIEKSKLPVGGIQLPVSCTGSKSLTICFRK